MTICLIDHATVTSVRRSLGAFRILGEDVTDIDHTALERFCNAVLFHDIVKIPDTYKQDLRMSRNDYLARLNIQPAPVLSNTSNAQIRHTVEHVISLWVSDPREETPGVIANEYLKRIESYFDYTWKGGNSSSYMITKFYGSEKGDAVIKALYKCPEHRSDLGIMSNLLNKTDKETNVQGKLEMFASRLAWTAHEYLWYQIYAAQIGATYIPHPLRDFFACDFLTKAGVSTNRPSALKAGLLDTISRFNGKYDESLRKLQIIAPSSSIRLPGVLPLLVSRSANGDEFLGQLLKLRESPEVSSLRQKLAQVQISIDDDSNFRDLKKLIAEIEKIGDNILLKNGLSERYITITPPTSFLGITFKNEDVSFKLPLPTVLFNQMFLGKKYTCFIRNVIEELSAVAQFGELKTKLNGFMNVHTSVNEVEPY